MTSPTMVAILAVILDFFRNQVKTRKNGIFFVLYMKNNTEISTLHNSSHKVFFLLLKQVEI